MQQTRACLDDDVYAKWLHSPVYDGSRHPRLGRFKSDQHHVHVCSDGDRYPIYRSQGNGLIDPALCIYMGVVRRRTPSVNTRLQRLRGATAITHYANHLGVSLSDRLRSGFFFVLSEQLGFDDFLSHTTGAAVCTRVIRHRDSLAYMRFLWRRRAASLVDDPKGRLLYLSLAQEFSTEFTEIIPWRGNQMAGQRSGLDNHARILLMQFLTDPTAVAKLWPDKFVAARNVLLMLCFVLTGHRVGELLCVRLSDLDLDALLYRVVRLHNSTSDPRVIQPLTKGRERELLWPAALVELTKSYMAERVKRPFAFKNNFLFLASSGHPMSRSLVSEIFSAVHKYIPELGDRFSPHVLRHTWNDMFSEAAQRMKLSPEAEIRARMIAMGWRSRATAVIYTRRYDAQIADELSIKMQEDLFGTVGGCW